MQKGPKHFSIEEEEEESFIFPGDTVEAAWQESSNRIRVLVVPMY
jgi:hypothetical protein